MEASHKKHRPHIKVGKDADEEEEVSCSCKTIDQTFPMHTYLRVCVAPKHMSTGCRGMTQAEWPCIDCRPLSLRVLDMEAIT